MSKKRGFASPVGIALATLLVTLSVLAAQPAAAQTYSYAAKFVCGFNRSNAGYGVPGEFGGEAIVKIGNYATEINIFNPSPDADISKRVLVLYDDQAFWPPVGREPNIVFPTGGEAIPLPNFAATMDDCNKIYQLLGIPLFVPPPLLVGFLVIQSNQPLDVVAVYTTEICSDWTILGANGMCTNGNGSFGAGLSIDVEQVAERRLP